VIWLAGLALVLLALCVLAFAQVVRWLIREHARERNLMLNQIMHLAGRTWQPPPTLEPAPFVEPEELLDPTLLPDY